MSVRQSLHHLLVCFSCSADWQVATRPWNLYASQYSRIRRVAESLVCVFFINMFLQYLAVTWPTLAAEVSWPWQTLASTRCHPAVSGVSWWKKNFWEHFFLWYFYKIKAGEVCHYLFVLTTQPKIILVFSFHVLLHLCSLVRSSLFFFCLRLTKTCKWSQTAQKEIWHLNCVTGCFAYFTVLQPKALWSFGFRLVTRNQLEKPEGELSK